MLSLVDSGWKWFHQVRTAAGAYFDGDLKKFFGTADSWSREQNQTVPEGESYSLFMCSRKGNGEPMIPTHVRMYTAMQLELQLRQLPLLPSRPPKFSQSHLDHDKAGAHVPRAQRDNLGVGRMRADWPPSADFRYSR
jgi:hypothetical protein